MACSRRSLILVTGLLAGLAIAAFGSRPARPSAHFTVFSSEPLVDLAHRRSAAEKDVPLTFYPTARSPSYEHDIGEPIVLVRRTTGEAVATVEVASELREFLLVIEPARAGVNVTVLDDSAAPFASGNLRVKNLSGLRLTGWINQQNACFPPGEERVLNTRTVVNVELRTELHGKSFPACGETFRCASGECAWLLLLPPLRPGSLEIQTRLLSAPVLRSRR